MKVLNNCFDHKSSISESLTYRLYPLPNTLAYSFFFIRFNYLIALSASALFMWAKLDIDVPPNPSKSLLS